MKRRRRRKMHDEVEDDEYECPACGGPMYTQPHWKYSQCDDCGFTEVKEGDYD
jgi:ribosomal protein L37AE/L43A